jgi:Protein of unknown function (DUF1573).
MSQIASILLSLFFVLSNIVSFDNTLHDFGRVEATTDPLICTYTFTNVSDSDIRIKYARSSCSCLSLVWTTDVVHPGDCGQVTARYKRQFEENSFDKSFKVVFEGDAGAFDLSLKGSFFETPSSLLSRFPVSRHPVLFNQEVFETGGLALNCSRYFDYSVANIGSDAVSLSFDGLPSFVKLKREVVIAPLGVSKVDLELSPNALEWGLHDYSITPIADSLRLEPVILRVLIIPDFSGLTVEEKYLGPYPSFSEQFIRVSSNCTCLDIPFRNIGKQALHLLSAECDVPGVTCEFPAEVPVGANAMLRCTFSAAFFDSTQDSGTLYIVSDSPVNPISRIGLSK